MIVSRAFLYFTANFTQNFYVDCFIKSLESPWSYSIFMALCYVLVSLSICTFEVCWKNPCGETSYFSGTIQLVLVAGQVSGFCIVWVFTIKNIRADYRFCCFNINKLSYYVIFRKSFCTTDLVPYLDAG